MRKATGRADSSVETALTRTRLGSQSGRDAVLNLFTNSAARTSGSEEAASLGSRFGSSSNVGLAAAARPGPARRGAARRSAAARYRGARITVVADRTRDSRESRVGRRVAGRLGRGRRRREE